MGNIRIIQEKKARESIADGTNLVGNLVRKTMGKNGRNIAIDTDKYSVPLFTNDGVTVARSIRGRTHIESVGVKAAQVAANRTEDEAGDATSTTLLLLQEFTNAGVKRIARHQEPIELRAEIESSVETVIANLKGLATPANTEKTLCDAATISSRDPKIGALVANAVFRAKEDGIVTLEDNLGGDTDIQEQSGLRLLTGWAAKQFINNPAQQQVIVSNPNILVTNMDLTSVEQFQTIVGKILVVLAQSIGAEFMMWSHLNWKRDDSPLKILPIQFNTAADIAEGMLRDVAAVADCMMIDTLLNQGLEQLDQEGVFGRVKRVIQEKKLTIIEPSNQVAVDRRVKELKQEWKGAHDYQAENIQERIARLKSACFTVRVGGSTINELRERKTRVRDALNTARAAYEGGVVIGGGLALAIASKDIPSKLVYDVCQQPLKQLAKNSNMSVKNWWYTVQGETNIIDATKAVIQAITNSSAQAIQLLLTEGSIIDPEVND
jgi:chaperonin GroEL